MKAPSLLTAVASFLNRHHKPLLGIIAGLFFLEVVGVTGTYLIYPGYLDHGEPSVTLISWRLLHGLPVFLDFDNPALISNIYGPLIYVVHAMSFWLLGPTVLAGKAASLLAATLIPVFVFLSQRQRGFPQAVTGAILACGLVLFHIPFSIWNRPDSYLTLLVVIAVWVANNADPERPEWAKSVLIAVVAGMAVGMKIHAGAYFAPVVLFHCLNENRGVKTFAIMAVVGLVVVFLPFAFSAFSLSVFVDWITLIAGKDSSSVFGSKFIRYMILYSAPLWFFLASRLWSAKRLPARENVYFWVFVVSFVAVLFPATKEGAGTHYFFPFLAVVIDLVLRHAGRVRKAGVWGLAGVLAVAILIVGIPVQKRFFRSLHWQDVAEIQMEIRTIMADFKGRSIEMGIGHNVAVYPRTLSRTLLVFAGHPYSFDAAPAMEMIRWNVPLPEGALSELRASKTDLWVIPKGEQPFMMTGYYGTPTVPPVFSETFRLRYSKAKTYKYFEVWACNR